MQGNNSLTTNINDYEIDGYEYGINVELIKPVPESIKLYIPKYMPNVSKGKWEEPISIDVNGLEVNESKVQLPTMTTEQGYITVGHFPNEHPDYTEKAVKVGSVLRVKPENSFMVRVLYGDPNEIYFIGRV